MGTLRQSFQVRVDYPVHFSEGVCAPTNPLLARVLGAGRNDGPARALVVVDQGVLDTHPNLIDDLRAYGNRHAGAMEWSGVPEPVPGGEAAKNDPAVVRRLQAAFDAARLCRHSYVVAIGGGAVLDAAGYAAATAHRGLRLVRVPTTVLAQADSAVGVKNGVNAFGKKNFLGTFTPPWAVLCDSTFLTTLAWRDWLSGIAEAVKVALIKDAAFFRMIERASKCLRRRDIDALKPVIYRSAQLHLEHIGQGGDPFEMGSARPLDFGHWSAHKLEALTDHRLRHGEAVAIGMALDVTYARLQGCLSESDWRRIVDTLASLGFQLTVPEMWTTQAGRWCLADGLQEFREHLGGRLTVLLLETVGRPVEVHALDVSTYWEAACVLERYAQTRLEPEPTPLPVGSGSERLEVRHAGS